MAAKQIQETRTVRANFDLATKLGDIARHRNITIQEVLDKYAGSAILREYRKVMTEKNAKVGPA